MKSTLRVALVGGGKQGSSVEFVGDDGSIATHAPVEVSSTFPQPPPMDWA